MITSVLVPYIVLLLILLFIIRILETSMSVVWTLLMSSYNLSLPGLLWCGGKFNFPTFIPPDSNSPMAFYYWFFVVAVILFCCFVALNAFRHLSFWAKFDNEAQAYEQTNFFHQFKWILILFIMTVLTPILIWVCYSVFMLGVYFFMALIGSDSMFVTISEADFNSLKQKYTDDLNQIINMDTSSVFNAIKLLLSDSTAKANLLEKLQSEAGLTEASANQYITALETIRDSLPSALSTIQSAAKSLKETLSQKSYSDPIALSELTSFKTTLNNLVMNYEYEVTSASVFGVEYSVWAAWMKIFGNSADSSETLNFKNLMAYAYYDKSTLPTQISALINVWEKPTSYSVYHVLGYGYGSSMQTKYASEVVAERLCGRQMYTVSSSKQYLFSYLSFKNGLEVGLKTCPLTKYINYAVSDSYISFSEQFESTAKLGIAGFVIATLGDIMKQITVTPTNGYLVYAGWALTLVGFIYMAPTLMTIVQAIIYIFCWRLMIKPMLGLVLFIWTSFIESMWYFFLLLPAIGASVADGQNKIWKEAWKHCIGKTASVVILWGAILLMFASLYQVDQLYQQIWESAKTLTDDWDGTTKFTIIIFGEQTGSSSSFLKELVAQTGATLVISLSLTINWCGIVEYILVLIILKATYKIIAQIGEIAFQNVYKELPNFQTQTLNSFMPGFSEGVAGVRKIGGVSSKVGGTLGSSVSSLASGVTSPITQYSKEKYDEKIRDDEHKFQEEQRKKERRGELYSMNKIIDTINSNSGNQFQKSQEQKTKTASTSKSRK